MKRNNTTVYVSFFGLPGSGKTTLSETVKEKMWKAGWEVLVRESSQTYTTKDRIFYFVVRPHELLRTVLFVWKHTDLFYNPNTRNRSRMYVYYKAVRNALCNYHVLKRESPDCVIKGDLSSCPEGRPVYVFVDTDPDEAFARMTKRSHSSPLEELIERRGEEYRKQYYADAHSTHKKLFRSMQKKKEEGVIAEVVHIHGTEPVEVNASRVTRVLEEVLLM